VSVTAYHSFVEKWRLEHPHDTPPYPFMPSPTFAHSSYRLRPGAKATDPVKRAVQRKLDEENTTPRDPWPRDARKPYDDVQ
jgi:hypothetical protein